MSEKEKQRFARRIEKRDRRIAGLERKIRMLEHGLSIRLIGLENLLILKEAEAQKKEWAKNINKDLLNTCL